MRTDYESVQSVEVIGPDETYQETEFTIGLECSNPSYPGHFDPRWGGEPPHGPEFDVTTIAVNVPKINYRTEVSLELTWDQFAALVGGETADALFDRAVDDATENGGF